MAASAPLLQLDRVCVQLGGREVLHDISLAIQPGEAVTIIGPNGAGKTTLARTLLGIVKPDRGTLVRRDGLSVGYVPQKLDLDASLPLTVRRLLCLTRKFSEKEMAASLDEVRASHLLDRQAHELSGGEYQRVLLARSLLGQPDLLLLDEPTRGIDFSGQGELYELLARVRQTRGCAIVLISHDLHVVMAASDRVVCVNGHICCEGAPEAVTSDPAYVALFGPGHKHALGVFKHHHDHEHGLALEPHDHD